MGVRSSPLAAALVALGFTLPTTPAEAQPDFAMVYASEPSPSLSAGDLVSVTYEVENRGTTTASSFTVGFVIDDGTQAYLLHEDTITSLAAGASTSGNMSFSVPTGVDGTWYAGIVADPLDAFVETDENDNVYVFQNQITIGGGTSGAISVISESLAAATVGASYSATLRQTGAPSPSWYVSSGSLPPGLSLSTSGQISGNPTTPGSFSFAVTAEQAGYTPGSGTFTIDVSEGGTSAIAVSPTELPEGRVGVPYEAALSASGGAPPYAYQLIGGAPSWLTAIGAGEEAGTLSGTPDAVGHHDVQLYVIDSAGTDATFTLSLDVVESGPLAVATSLPAGVTSKAYAASLVTGGVPPYTVEIAGGSLPTGLTVDAQGQITGVPTEPGDFTFDVTVSDNQGASTSGQAAITVTEFQELSISSTLISVFANTDADAPLTAMGGVPPYTWQMVGGALPEGVSFDAAAGKIVGRPMRVGQGTGTFMVTDAEGNTAQADVEVRVQVWRSGGGGGAGGSRRRGCTCVTTSGPSPAFLLLGLLGFVIRRR